MIGPAELESLEARLRAVEARTGAQVVLALLDRADAYHGLRWRAYALGSILAGGGVAIGGALRPAWVPAHAAFAAVAAVLGAGLAFALAATLLPAFARLFLEPGRAELEVRRRAGAVFFERGLFATRGRTAVLLLACRFERQVVLLADRGFDGRVEAQEWDAVRRPAAGLLREGREAEALGAGLDALERLLAAKGFAPPPGGANELPDAPIVGRGA